MTVNTNDQIFVVFTPSGKRGKFPHGTPVLKAARSLGVDLDSICGGRGLCGRCQIQPGIGDFSKFNIKCDQTALSEMNEVEARYRSKKKMKDDHRLGCNTKLLKDCVIDIPPESQTHKQVIRKAASVRHIELDPIISLHVIEVEEPDMHHPSGDLERVLEALHQQWDLTILALDVDLSVLIKLQKNLRDGKWTVTCAIRKGHELIAIWPGLQDKAFGMAIDLGSTTVSAHLTDLRSGDVVAAVGAMNPQIRFGEDLMSRVSYVMMNEGGEIELTQAIRNSVNDLILEACKEAEVDQNLLLEIVLVGNPVMHHLFLGLNPVELGWAPFALVSNQAIERRARELEITSTALGARIYILPCVAGHVGADAASVVLSEEPYNKEEITLIVDVGTNAEIIYGNKDRLLACSSPTGPALEGAQISAGQRAAAGAIERVRIDPVTLEPKLSVIGSDKWSNEEGFADSIKKIGVTGICGSGIIEVIAEMFLCGILSVDGIIQGHMAEKTDRVVGNKRTFDYILYRGDPEIRVTQADIRAIQLAKGALHAGAQLLIDKLGKSPERIILAGAFGSHIDPKYAMILGLIPDAPITHVASAGNAAGTGARIALLNMKKRNEIEQQVAAIEKIETAVETKFQEHFVGAMAIPHKTDPYSLLRAAVPEVPAFNLSASEGSSNTGRKRRRSHDKN